MSDSTANPTLSAQTRPQQAPANSSQHTLRPPSLNDLHALHMSVTPEPSDFSDVDDSPDSPDTPLIFHHDPADEEEKADTHTAHPSTFYSPAFTLVPVPSPDTRSLPTVVAPNPAVTVYPPFPAACKVVNCDAAPARDGYCLPHHAAFLPAISDSSDDAGREQRERRDRKQRDAHLAVLREKSHTMPSPSTSPAPSPPPSQAPSWFARPRKASATDPTPDDTTPPTDALLAETRKAWRGASRVVFKDLPRLAKRMSVIDDKRVWVLWGRTVEGDEDVDRATKPREAVQTAAVAGEQAPGQLVSDTAAPLAEPPSPKSRVKGKEVVEDALAEVSTWEAVTNVVMAVAEHLEAAPVVQRLRDTFERVEAGVGPQTDLEGELEGVFREEVGLGSATFAVFRGCHQSILFAAVYQLKTTVYGAVGQMRDVRRQDGWTVEIYVGDGRVWVTHERTEQSMEAENDPNHFEVRWEIRSGSQ